MRAFWPSAWACNILRDLDGATILVLPEREVEVLRRIGAAAANLAGVERLAEVASMREPEVAEYGEWSWLRVFEAEDLRDVIRDVREAIIVGVREGSTALLDEQLRAWRVTAEQAEDPLAEGLQQSPAAGCSSTASTQRSGTSRSNG